MPAQTAGTQRRADEAQIPSYAVVSIRKAKEGKGRDYWLNTQDGFLMHGETVKEMIADAYGFSFGPLKDSELIGLPEWCRTERFDMQGKVDVEDAASLKALKDRDTVVTQIRERAQRTPTVEMLLMQRMLERYFQVKVHYEQRELPVYALTVAKGGVKMKVAPPEKANDITLQIENGMMEGKNMPVGIISNFLQVDLDRPVVDRTGANANYDYELKWAQETGKQAAAGGDNGPSLFTAVEEQLGLKLVPAKAPVWVVVADHVERPDGN